MGVKVPKGRPEEQVRLKHFFAALFIGGLALNWLWEMVQMPAYAEMAGHSWLEAAFPCLVASLGDVAITFLIYGIGALAAGRLRWGMEGGWNVYLAAALLGAGCAVAIEWKALSAGQWSYTDQMPIVPLLEVGLWPVLQLTLLVPAAIGIAALWGKPAERKVIG